MRCYRKWKTTDPLAKREEEKKNLLEPLRQYKTGCVGEKWGTFRHYRLCSTSESLLNLRISVCYIVIEKFRGQPSAYGKIKINGWIGMGEGGKWLAAIFTTLKIICNCDIVPVRTGTKWKLKIQFKQIEIHVWSNIFVRLHVIMKRNADGYAQMLGRSSMARRKSEIPR